MKVSNIQLEWHFERRRCSVFILLSLLSPGALVQLREGVVEGKKPEDLREMRVLASYRVTFMVRYTRHPQKRVEGWPVHSKNIPVSIWRKKVENADTSTAICSELW